VKAAYDAVRVDSWIEERTRMMQQYADFLDNIREKARESAADTP